MDMNHNRYGGSGNRVGLLLIGASGGNGLAITQAVERLRGIDSAVEYGITSLPIFEPEHFPEAEDIIVGGWDVRNLDVDRLEEGRAAPGLWSGADTAIGDEIAGREWQDVREARDWVAEEIADFAMRYNVNRTIVLNMSSPARRLRRPLAEWSEQEVLEAGPAEMPSAVPYALGALHAGASFIDFTPSETLEWPLLWQRAIEKDAQVAGRDGSTGQTFLKALIGSALEMRGLRVASWYSTNILGNRDGAVLTLPGVDVTKQADKAHALRHMTKLETSGHQVDIRYLEELGDYKEAWDSVLCRDFLGNQVELRLNWKALDSPLAAQLALDVIRMIASGHGRKRGLRRDLAIFFKHPVGGVVPRSPMEHLNELIEANTELLRVGANRDDLPW
ncbi:myo-inositol-1-phosphate synthase (plasmid) [Arthrobacter sp. ZXY-2]|nr:myo-inositol-1-phosphate synthase [Arthrobacter sp. ZXY-2]